MTRRQWLGTAGGASFLGFLNPALLHAARSGGSRTADSVILLWMSGGMSHIDTFDPQPGEAVGGPFKATDTTADGIRISEHLPRLAKTFEHLSLIRSMTSNEAAHDRATYLMHTGYPPIASIKHSSLGSIVSKYKGPSDDDPNLPPYVSIGIDWAAGYLGPKFAPYYIGSPQQGDANLVFPQGMAAWRYNVRLKLLHEFDKNFTAQRRDNDLLSAYADHFNAALLMMRRQTAQVFDLDDEPQPMRDAYGASSGFGQGCLLARRLVQAGVRFVEVQLGGWDTHQNNFETVQTKSAELDTAVSMLINDLRNQGLYERTVIVLTSEFGRTPKINGNNGRDHYPRVWSTLIGGGGIRPGQLIGRSDRGQAVADHAVRVGNLHATLCKALGVDYTQTNHAPDGRPFRIIKDHDARPIDDLFA